MAGAAALWTVVESRAELRHWIVGEAGQEDDHVGPDEIRRGEGHDVLADERDLRGQVVAEPGEVGDRHSIPAGGQAGGQHRPDVTGATSNEDPHGSSPPMRKACASGRSSHSASDWASASLRERMGSRTGQSMPILGSSQRTPDSAIGL